MIVLESQYWPSLPWMKSFMNTDRVLIEQWENYQKQGLRNRCKIVGAQKIITLSIPIEGGRDQKSLIKDIKINYSDNWITKQLRTIKSCYAKAPYFEFYYPEVKNILEKKHIYLIDLNMNILDKLCKWIKWNGAVRLTDEFISPSDKSSVAQIQLKSPQLKPYMQVFSDRFEFQPVVSILDTLFCLGPSTATYLQS